MKSDIQAGGGVGGEDDLSRIRYPKQFGKVLPGVEDNPRGLRGEVVTRPAGVGAHVDHEMSYGLYYRRRFGMGRGCVVKIDHIAQGRTRRSAVARAVAISYMFDSYPTSSLPLRL